MAEQYGRITIVGAGAWGSALATLATEGQNEVRLWSRRSGQALGPWVETSDVLLITVSMKGVRDTIARLQAIPLPPDLIIVTATKGLDPETQQTPAQLWHAAFRDHPIVVLCGPNLSKEIQQGLPAATAVASDDLEAAATVQHYFASDRFRVYFNEDPLGTELGGTLKNVMAIAAGVCDGLALGTNAKAALLTRALPEMVRVGVTLGAQPDTFFGLSGLGDLLATCSSPLSRNYQVGYGLGQGKTLTEILDHLEGTAEGVNTAAVLVTLAQRDAIAVPIATAVHHLLQAQITPLDAVQSLMERDLKSEFGAWLRRS
ncbi:NAD(P)H-dependent glycerol-3-phosphate dehydrogenase [Spirulina major]|uniref:NAD(P)H-dependent glycerol-3-phosphate dehydrogenase n=1 Tax=Spirulina major TaxID=270636 RepID=UPI00093475EB|nr:NAD(P)H-dependent glycerol-3-phosphate dehydrogenase [Spirulina major]